MSLLIAMLISHGAKNDHDAKAAAKLITHQCHELKVAEKKDDHKRLDKAGDEIYRIMEKYGIEDLQPDEMCE